MLISEMRSDLILRQPNSLKEIVYRQIRMVVHE